MSDPYIGEIRISPYTFAPQGWLYCDGSLQSIAAYGQLFQVLGTTYGGDGQTNFGLPDLRSRVPVHQDTASGTEYPLAQLGGTEQAKLEFEHLPVHSHPFVAADFDADQDGPGNNFPAITNSPAYTADASNLTPMGPIAIAPTGGGQPHDNIMPYLGIAFIISTSGLSPTQN